MANLPGVPSVPGLPSIPDLSNNPNNKNLQYLRQFNLVVYGNDLNGLDLSQLRIKFSVKRTDAMTPNTADIRVYNLEEQTAVHVRKAFTRVVLQAGYPGNYGVIFQGNIKQVILGRESASDTFIDIVAGDGDRAYNFSIVNSTISKGSTQQAQITQALNAMKPKGVTTGNIDLVTSQAPQRLPRGKSMYGEAKIYLRGVAQTTKSSWSIQDEKVNFVPKTAYLPGTAVEVNAKNGMIGTPQQTDYGVNVKCLLNPSLAISQRVHLDNSTVQRLRLPIEQIAAAKGDVKQIIAVTPRQLQADGMYYAQVIQHTGDTRGIEWYTSITGISIDVTTNPLNSVGGFSG